MEVLKDADATAIYGSKELMVYEDRVWRNYSVQTLAKEYGFTNRTSFAKSFLAINGMSVKDFVTKRNKELAD